MQHIDPRFSFDGLDLPAMQRSVESVTKAIEKQVMEGIAKGEIDKELLVLSQ